MHKLNINTFAQTAGDYGSPVSSAERSAFEEWVHQRRGVRKETSFFTFFELMWFNRFDPLLFCVPDFENVGDSAVPQLVDILIDYLRMFPNKDRKPFFLEEHDDESRRISVRNSIDEGELRIDEYTSCHGPVEFTRHISWLAASLTPQSAVDRDTFTDRAIQDLVEEWPRVDNLHLPSSRLPREVRHKTFFNCAVGRGDFVGCRFVDCMLLGDPGSVVGCDFYNCLGENKDTPAPGWLATDNKFKNSFTYTIKVDPAILSGANVNIVQGPTAAGLYHRCVERRTRRWCR